MRIKVGVYVDVSDSLSGFCGPTCQFLRKEGKSYCCALSDNTKLQTDKLNAPMRARVCKDLEVS